MDTTLLLPALLELLAKSALLLLGTAALTAAARRLSAAQQHAIWLTVFAALLLLPLTKSIAPRWHLPGSPGTPVVNALPALPEIQIAAPTPGVVATPPAKSFHLPDARHLALFAWLAGTAAIIGYRLLGSWQITGLRRGSVTADSPRLARLAQQAAAEMHLRTPCSIRLSAAARVPCTWGVRRSIVMLPASAEEWSDTRLLAALRHEFAHVARRDYLARWLTLLTCALYWPNPLVWLAARRLRMAQEQACDDLVLWAGTPPADYAALLVESARASLRSSGAGWRVAVAMARPSTLEGRVLAIVDEDRSRRPAGRAVSVAAAFGLAAVIGASALAQIAPEKTAPGPAAAAPNQIRIVTKFLEMPTGALYHLNVPDEKVSMVWSKPQADENWRAFQKAKGVDVLSAPAVTVGSGRSATVQLGREYDLPAGSPTPKKFLGIILELKATAFATDIDLDTLVLRSALKEADTVTAGKPVFDDQRNRVEVTMLDQSTVAIRLGNAQREGREIWAWVEVSKIAPQNAAAKDEAATPALEPLSNVSVVGSDIPRLAAEGKLTVSAEGKPVQASGTPAPPVGQLQGGNLLIESSAIHRAREIVVPRLELREATLVEAVDFLRARAAELDPKKEGINIVLKPAANTADTKITISLTKIPLLEALRYVANLADLEMRVEPNAVVIGPASPASLASAKPTLEITAKEGTFDQKTGTALFSGEVTVSAGTLTLNGLNTHAADRGSGEVIKPGEAPVVLETDQLKVTIPRPAPQESAALKKAGEIIIPRLETREAPLSEMLELLRKKAVEFDPAKTGVNIVLKPGAKADARITLSLTNVPLIEALKYTASLAELKLRAEAEAIVLEP